METDAPAARRLRLTFAAQVEAAILANPRLRFNFSTIQGEEKSEGILLRRADGETLKILKAESDDPSLGARIETITQNKEFGALKAQPGDVWLEVTVKPSSTSGSRNGSIRLATNHPDLQHIEVPYRLRIQPLIEARPASVRLWTSGEGRLGNSVSVAVKGQHGKPFFITGIESSNPEIFEVSEIFDASANSKDVSSRRYIRVGLVEGLQPEAVGSLVKGSINITTDNTIQPVLKVPVTITPERPNSRRSTYRKRPASRAPAGTEKDS